MDREGRGQRGRRKERADVSLVEHADSTQTADACFRLEGVTTFLADVSLVGLDTAGREPIGACLEAGRR